MTLLTDSHSGGRSLVAFLLDAPASLVGALSIAMRRYQALREEESLGIEMRKDIGYRPLADHE